MSSLTWDYWDRWRARIEEERREAERKEQIRLLKAERLRADRLQRDEAERYWREHFGIACARCGAMTGQDVCRDCANRYLRRRADRWWNGRPMRGGVSLRVGKMRSRSDEDDPGFENVVRAIEDGSYEGNE